ncbi:MAG: hypothetical protein LBS65_10455 [Desulfovibrio sp.]|jgi:hypothetical protein|nr:hypothetical protein [Desulfovibrio sp.]
MTWAYLAENEKQNNAMMGSQCLLTYATFASFFGMMLIFISSLLITLLLVTKFTSTRSILPLAIIITSILSARILKNLRANAIALFVTLFVLAVFLLLGLVYPDFSCDGLGYHQWTTTSAAAGVNLFFTSTGNMWSDSYPKIYELFCAEIFKIWPAVNASAFLQFIFIATTFAYSLRLGGVYNIALWKNLIMALLVTFNPVMVSQLYTYYIDCAMANCAYIIIASMLLILKDDLILDKTMFFAASSFVIATKMSGVLYPSTAFLLFGCVGLYESRSFLKTAKRYLPLFILTFGIGFGLFGFQPYITNILSGKHIMHPLEGENKIDILTANMPENFQGRNRFIKVIKSSLSDTDNLVRPYNATINVIPGSITQRAWYMSGVNDVRIAGWGPEFFLCMLLGGALLLCYKANWYLLGLIASYILLTIFIHPEGWWARYAPQLYFGAAMVPLVLKEETYPLARKLSLPMFSGFLCAIFLNLFLYTSANINFTREMDARLKALADQTLGKQSITLCLPNLNSYYDNLLKHYGISYNHVPKSVCEQSGRPVQQMYFFSYMINE